MSPGSSSVAGHHLGDLEPLLETIMLEDFNVQAEDGSPGQVGQALLHWYQQCLTGDFTLVEQLRNVSSGAEKSRGHKVSLIQSRASICMQLKYLACSPKPISSLGGLSSALILSHYITYYYYITSITLHITTTTAAAAAAALAPHQTTKQEDTICMVM
jgi:hypothetical protein